MEQMHTKGKRMQFHLGHNFNWELANVAVSSYTSYFVLVVYMPVKNQVFDKIMLKIRSSKNNALLPATDMKNAMIPYRSSQYLLALVADQVPGDPAKAYWMNFFGRPTPFMRGPERGATARFSKRSAGTTNWRQNFALKTLQPCRRAKLPAGM